MIPLEVRVKPISALPDGLEKGPPICSDHRPPPQCQKIFLPANIGTTLLRQAVLL